MKTISKAISRGLMTLAVAGLGLILTPQSASASIVFGVDESVVDETAFECGVLDCTYDADKLSGLYGEVLTINPDLTFDVSARAIFDQYGLAGGDVGTGLLGGPEALVDGSYKIYALFTGSGSVSKTGVIKFTSADVSLYVDTDSDTTFTAPGTGTGAWTRGLFADDELVLSSTTLVKGTGELVPPVGGFFDLIFTSLVLTPFGSVYYPTLTSLLLSTVDGDFDTVPSPPVPGSYSVTGDLSVVYDVPEPATLTLLGLGLLGSGFAARRRRNQSQI